MSLNSSSTSAMSCESSASFEPLTSNSFSISRTSSSEAWLFSMPNSVCQSCDLISVVTGLGEVGFQFDPAKHHCRSPWLCVAWRRSGFDGRSRPPIDLWGGCGPQSILRSSRQHSRIQRRIRRECPACENRSEFRSTESASHRTRRLCLRVVPRTTGQLVVELDGCEI